MAEHLPRRLAGPGRGLSSRPARAQSAPGGNGPPLPAGGPLCNRGRRRTDDALHKPGRTPQPGHPLRGTGREAAFDRVCGRALPGGGPAPGRAGLRAGDSLAHPVARPFPAAGRAVVISLPLLPTSTIGSYAPPSWFCAAVAANERGEFGPTDREETYQDATRIALLDQEHAGIDLPTEGEMRRVDFNLGFYGRLRGLEKLPPQRTHGPDGHDMRDRYRVVDRITAPTGLGILEEFEFARTQTTRRLKVTCPGPYTLAGRPQGDRIYTDRYAVARDMAEIINAELRRCVAAGATFLQLDEPSAAVYPERPEAFVELIQRTVAGLSARIGMHLCFGNFRGRAVGKRQYEPLFPHIL
ncbi:MAG: hypothetical protein FJX77_11185, partial [Armatimonadetes bacterium]|nr:hypothetical protein [Armatimonadota bacterium]